MKLFVVVGFMGVAFVGSQSFAQIACPAQPTYENCEQMDYSCQSRNNTARNDFNYKMSVCQAGAQNQNATSTGIQAPTPPVPKNCTNPTTGAVDSACTAANQAAQQSYQTALQNYNTVKAQEVAAQQALQQQQYNSAMEAARAAQAANQGGSDKYNLASTLCTVTSLVLMVPCSAPGGQSACIASAAFGVFSMLAGSQASSHDSVKYDACTAANQISTNPVGCGSPPTPFVPSNWPANTTDPLTQNFDPNGNCIGTPAQCAQIVNNLPPGTNIKDAMDAISKFASGKGPFKVNPDGSITMKNGKTYTPADFASEAAMVAAGMTPGQAAALMADINRTKAFGDINAKEALAKENDLGADSGALAAAAGKPGESGAGNGDAAGSGKDLSNKRALASMEGLTKDFNGNMIGCAGDDIFKMMHRKYRLKDDQDSFINGGGKIKP